MLINWKPFKLIELYDISSGLSKSAEEFGFGFPFLSFSTVFKNYFIPEELDQLVNSSIKEQTSCSIKKGDVFLTRTSEVIEELGMSCVALKDYPNATFNGFTKRLRPKNEEEVDPLFIGYYLRNIQFRAEISAYSTLTTRASLNNGIIEKLKITIPSLPVQQKIASILSSYDELIENNKQRIRLLEEMAEEIYKEWFVRLRFPGYENANIVDGLPEGWGRLNLNKIYNINYGKNLPQTEISEFGNYPVYGASGIMGYYSNFNVKEKVVLVTSRGNGSGEIHRTHEIAFVTNNSFIVLPKKEYSYLEIGFNFHFFKNLYLNRFCTGSAQPQLTNSAMTNIEVVLPSEDIIKKYCTISTSQIELIDYLLKKNQLLQETRDLLLPRLISGKLSVAHLVDKVEELGMVTEPREIN